MFPAIKLALLMRCHFLFACVNGSTCDSGEAERIKKCRGRVFALQDEPEVPRVWLPFDDAPGLAMARAFGDFCLKDYGVISVPEFFHWSLTEKDQFVILASDGVISSTKSSNLVFTVLFSDICAFRYYAFEYISDPTKSCHNLFSSEHD